MTEIGRIKSIHRYPVKSMRGEALTQATVHFAGLVGDRVWAFTRDDKKPDFPWHSAREANNLLLYTPKFDQDPPADQPYPQATAFNALVTAPDGERYAIDSQELSERLAKETGHAVQLRFSEKGMPDARPISIFANDTLKALSDEVGMALDPLRFRANFYVEWNNHEAFYEDTLVGRNIKIGDTVELAIVKKDPRCVIITMDPSTAELEPKVLKTVAKKHAGCIGVYAAVLREGVVKDGDAIELIEG